MGLTVTAPTGAPFFPPFPKPNTCLPSFLSFMVQVRANVSSAWAVSMSSHSFARVVEYAMAITGGNFNDVSGIERLVAFLAKCPRIER